MTAEQTANPSTAEPPIFGELYEALRAGGFDESDADIALEVFRGYVPVSTDWRVACEHGSTQTHSEQSARRQAARLGCPGIRLQRRVSIDVASASDWLDVDQVTGA